jgi:DNA-binding NarL/FixJ family response regulator
MGWSVRVLIVDDQDFVRRWLKAFLAQEPDIQVCGEAQDGRDAIHMVEKLLPDVVIMDISMPVVDGLRATRVIREFFPKIQVVTVSQYELGHVGDVLQVGAQAHVSKFAICEMLVPALRDLSIEKTVN